MGLARFAMKLFIYKWKYLHNNLHNICIMGKPVERILLTQLIELLPLSSENLFLMLYKIFLRASGNKRVCISL